MSISRFTVTGTITIQTGRVWYASPTQGTALWRQVSTMASGQRVYLRYTPESGQIELDERTTLQQLSIYRGNNHPLVFAADDDTFYFYTHGATHRLKVERQAAEFQRLGEKMTIKTFAWVPLGAQFQTPDSRSWIKMGPDQALPVVPEAQAPDDMLVVEEDDCKLAPDAEIRNWSPAHNPLRWTVVADAVPGGVDYVVTHRLLTKISADAGVSQANIQWALWLNDPWLIFREVSRCLNPETGEATLAGMLVNEEQRVRRVCLTTRQRDQLRRLLDGASGLSQAESDNLFDLLC